MEEGGVREQGNGEWDRMGNPETIKDSTAKIETHRKRQEKVRNQSCAHALKEAPGTEVTGVTWVQIHQKTLGFMFVQLPQ